MEALYLHLLLFVLTFSNKSGTKKIILAGWGECVCGSVSPSMISSKSPSSAVSVHEFMVFHVCFQACLCCSCYRGSLSRPLSTTSGELSVATSSPLTAVHRISRLFIHFRCWILTRKSEYKWIKEAPAILIVVVS